MQTTICPKCGQQIREFVTKNGNKGVGCSNKDCDFVIWRNSSGHEFTDEEIDALIYNKVNNTGAKLDLNFVSQKGQTYPAKFFINDEWKVEREVHFENNQGGAQGQGQPQTDAQGGFVPPQI